MFGGGTKPSAYCKLSTYVQHNAPLLYDNIQDLCMFGALNARGKTGVTLLLPDFSVQKHINKTVGTNAADAVKMINRLIIPKYIGDIKDFSKGFTNKAGETVNDVIIDGDHAKISEKTKIKTNDGFIRLHDVNPKIACYKLEGPPPTGESNKNGGLEEYQDRSGGNYVGGNDDFGERFGAKFSFIRDNWWDGQCNVLFAQLQNYVKTSKGVDPLTHCTISILEFVKKNDDKLFEFLCKVNPCSPLYCLFLGDILTHTQVCNFQEDWWNSNAVYNKFEALKEQVKLDKPRLNDINTHKQKYISRIAIGAALESAKNVIKVSIGECGDDIMKKLGFGGPDNVIDWVLSVQEFCYYFTVPYITAVNEGDTESINRIIGMFRSHIIKQPNYSKRTLFIDPGPGSNLIQCSKEHFCSNLSFYTNYICGSAGLDWNAADKQSDDSTKEVKYGWGDIRPDILTRTSFQNIVARFWNNTVRE